MRTLMHWLLFPLLMALCLARVLAGEWYFLSASQTNDLDFAKLIADQGKSSPIQLDAPWRRVDYFPHEVSTEKIFPSSLYWYATAADVPVAWRNRGFLLDWGVIM